MSGVLENGKQAQPDPTMKTQTQHPTEAPPKSDQPQIVAILPLPGPANSLALSGKPVSRMSLTIDGRRYCGTNIDGFELNPKFVIGI